MTALLKILAVLAAYLSVVGIGIAENQNEHRSMCPWRRS